MERKVEKCTWALSLTLGWVKESALYYTDEKPTVFAKKTSDTVLVREYISSGAKPTKEHCNEIWNCGNQTKVDSALSKFGKKPKNPYM